MYTYILVSTDGSELAQRGVDHGLSLAKTLGSKVTIVTVTEPFPILAMGYGGWASGAAGFEGLRGQPDGICRGNTLGDQGAGCKNGA